MVVSTLYRAGSGSPLCSMWWLYGDKTFFLHVFFFQFKTSKNRKKAVLRGRASAYESLLGIAWHTLSISWPIPKQNSEGVSWHRPKVYHSVLPAKQQPSTLNSPSKPISFGNRNTAFVHLCLQHATPHTVRSAAFHHLSLLLLVSTFQCSWTGVIKSRHPLCCLTCFFQESTQTRRALQAWERI